MSNRRSRSKSYYSPASDRYVDNKSKQLLFEEAHTCALGKTVIKQGEPFTESTANSLIEKHAKKRRSHGMVYCLVDRIRFDKGSSSRKELNYREIKHFYEHQQKPEYFTLAIEDEKNNKRSYESFKCKKSEDVVLLHNVITKATQDPQYLLKDAMPIRQISFSPENRHRSYDGSEKTFIISDDNNKPYPQRTIHNTYVHTQYRSPSPEEVYPHRNSRVVSVERSRTRSGLARIGILDDVTYLSVDSANGPRVTPEGPIYLYVSRFPSVNNVNHSPEYGRRRSSIYNQ